LGEYRRDPAGVAGPFAFPMSHRIRAWWPIIRSANLDIDCSSPPWSGRLPALGIAGTAGKTSIERPSGPRRCRRFGYRAPCRSDAIDWRSMKRKRSRSSGQGKPRLAERHVALAQPRTESERDRGCRMHLAAPFPFTSISPTWELTRTSSSTRSRPTWREGSAMTRAGLVAPLDALAVRTRPALSGTRLGSSATYRYRSHQVRVGSAA
jgi:hypothetical protein